MCVCVCLRGAFDVLRHWPQTCHCNCVQLLSHPFTIETHTHTHTPKTTKTKTPLRGILRPREICVIYTHTRTLCSTPLVMSKLNCFSCRKAFWVCVCVLCLKLCLSVRVSSRLVSASVGQRCTSEGCEIRHPVGQSCRNAL